VEFAASLATIGGFESSPVIAVAVSGGPDSLALTLLADRWARGLGGRAWGLTVDHGLRPESAREARIVAGWLAARGIPHATLAWVGARPQSGIQQAAREARYRLLSGWCRDHGVLHLLTAHHRADQVETHLMRRRAGSGIDGLAGMSAVRELRFCRVLRPLLGVEQARLRAFLAAVGQPHLCDPSNLNPAYERTRVRAAATALDNAAREVVLDALRGAGRLRMAREQALDALLGRSVALHPAGFAAIDRVVLETSDAECVERLLGRVARCIGGARYPARLERLARLRAALTKAPDRGRTLGGCRFVPWRGHFLVMRELAAASPPVLLPPGKPVFWDRRFAVEPIAEPAAFRLGYLGQIGGVPAELGAAGTPRLVYPVLPALWDERGLAVVPHLGYRRAGVGLLPRLAFHPQSGLTQAGFTVV
jgi:tRNA(Ile)-lysidine synthase